MADKINFTKVLLLKRRFWTRMGVLARALIKKDMRKGILQNTISDIPPLPYSTKSKYKDYKDNYMNRFGRGKNKVGKGKKLKAYAGQSVKSNETNNPNMLLTGSLIDGLRVIKTTAISATLSYMSKDAKRLAGNEALSRWIRGLREKNQTKLQRMLEIEYEKNLKIWAKKPIIIEVAR